jgi:hypothetical protein
VTSSDSGFTHQAAIYSSDEEFIETAIPFILAGLDSAEPVLVSTTPANLQLIGRALGRQARRVDFAETAYFGRRPIERISLFHRYWRRHARAGATRVRVLAEPVWTGRSNDQITAWQRMEASLNLALADAGIFMICPYDTRILDPAIIAAARRTHPHNVSGGTTRPCAEYADPHDFARECDATPLAPVPADAATFRGETNLGSLRGFVADQACGHGMSAERVALLVLAVGEAATYLKGQRRGESPPTVQVWNGFGAVVCELHQPGCRVTDPVLGLRPPDIAPARPGDGMHLAHHLCERLEIRSTDTGCTIRLYSRDNRNAEEFPPSALAPF